MTRILKQSDINFIISELKAGRIVAFATDTVFGVGVVYNNYQAVKRLKAAKGRDENKPFPLMVYNSSQMHQVAFLNEREERIVDTLGGAVGRITHGLTDGSGGDRHPDHTQLLFGCLSRWYYYPGNYIRQYAWPYGGEQRNYDGA